MYGRKKYGSRGKVVPAVPPIPITAVPTFVCSPCGKIKSMAQPYLELTGTQRGELFLYTKICEDCTKFLQWWMNSYGEKKA